MLFKISLFHYIILKVAIKKKLNPTSIQTNKFIAELPENRENIRAHVEFRHDLLESQKRVNYQSEFDRLQGAKKLSGLGTHVKSRMKGLQSMARKPLQGDGGTHRIYFRTFQFIIRYIMDSYHKRKMLENKYGKLITLTIQ